jgi:outer membrane receptor for ferrienterochelin and colicin
MFMLLLKKLACGLALCLLVAGPAFAQGVPTGTISGQVVSDIGPLPGVTVTASSPNLQGVRTTVTSENGDYILPQLPPGDYVIMFTLDGFQTIQHETRVAPAQTMPVNVTLHVAQVAETVTVTAQLEPFAQTSQVSTSFRQDLMDRLPTARTLNAAVLLAPGVQATGPAGNITMSGATSFESLFMINGVVVNENIRGQAHALFIEDAIQETTVQTAGVSAEYGRFAGGVVNAITRSGGNQFSGSVRTGFTNDSWRARTPFGEPKDDTTVPTYTFTLGGPVLRDHIWFFGAGRLEERTAARQTTHTLLGYTFIDDERRWEGKITGSITPNHTFRGSYIYGNRDQSNDSFGVVMDQRSLYNRSLPSDLTSISYTGVLTPRLFVEAQMARKTFTFAGSGSQTTDLIEGTLLLDRARGNTRYWAPTFCAVCGDEERNNDNLMAKATYFLSTSNWGSHNLVFGYDTFNDVRLVNNHQSGSDYRILGTTSIIRGADIFPVFNNDGSTLIQWNPIYERSRGTDFRTHSLFFNDNWRYNSQFTFNLGMRYDRNDGKDSVGTSVATDSAFSPRLGVTYAPVADGRWTVNASFGRYVAAVANSIANSGSPGGSPATFQWQYRGPAINVGNPASPTSTPQALRTLFDWFEAQGGTNMPPALASLPGVATRIDGSLRSPSTWEFSTGVSRQLGQRGLARVDGIYRDFRDFYGSFTDMTTGQVTNDLGQVFDRTWVRNTNDVERKYVGVNMQVSYRLNRTTVGGNWTVSRARGNFDGENQASGPLTNAINAYPEYREARWNQPVGPLSIDATHKGRFWATYDLPLPARAGSLNVSGLQHINSGTPYEAAGLVDVRPYVVNPGYRTPQGGASLTYYFTERGAFRLPTTYRTDFAMNYSLRIPALRTTTLFAQGQILNLFNGTKLANPQFMNFTTLTRVNTTALQAFNPFTDTPAEGAHWQYGPNFGKATDYRAYQLPRTYLFSVGVRF